MFTDPNDPSRLSRTKLTSAATALVAALVAVAALFGLVIPDNLSEALVPVFVLLLSLGDYFLRDALPPKKP